MKHQEYYTIMKNEVFARLDKLLQSKKNVRLTSKQAIIETLEDIFDDDKNDFYGFIWDVAENLLKTKKVPLMVGKNFEDSWGGILELFWADYTGRTDVLKDFCKYYEKKHNVTLKAHKTTARKPATRKPTARKPARK